MNRTEIDLSICIPTNGVVEWVIPVIDSIYREKEVLGTFEVIVTDNGNNLEFERIMTKYVMVYPNFVYQKTNSELFLNQIEAFKLAKGNFIKFFNHRMTLNSGGLNYLIKYAQDNVHKKPVTYFSNGELQLPESNTFHSFDEFVYNLSIYSSWSLGTSMWRVDFEKMDLNHTFNELFPHTDMVFNGRNNDIYLINNKKLFTEIPSDNTKKGNYDVFRAFAVDYVAIIEKLYLASDISKSTYEYIKEQNLIFVSTLYYNYILRKQACSYKLDGFKDAIKVYYNKKMVNKQILIIIIESLKRRIKKMFNHTQ